MSTEFQVDLSSSDWEDIDGEVILFAGEEIQSVDYAEDTWGLFATNRDGYRGFTPFGERATGQTASWLAATGRPFPRTVTIYLTRTAVSVVENTDQGPRLWVRIPRAMVDPDWDEMVFPTGGKVFYREGSIWLLFDNALVDLSLVSDKWYRFRRDSVQGSPSPGGEATSEWWDLQSAPPAWDPDPSRTLPQPLGAPAVSDPPPGFDQFQFRSVDFQYLNTASGTQGLVLLSQGYYVHVIGMEYFSGFTTLSFSSTVGSPYILGGDPVSGPQAAKWVGRAVFQAAGYRSITPFIDLADVAPNSVLDSQPLSGNAEEMSMAAQGDRVWVTTDDCVFRAFPNGTSRAWTAPAGRQTERTPRFNTLDRCVRIRSLTFNREFPVLLLEALPATGMSDELIIMDPSFRSILFRRFYPNHVPSISAPAGRAGSFENQLVPGRTPSPKMGQPPVAP